LQKCPLRFGIKLRQWAQKCISAMPVRQRIDKQRSPAQLSHPHETFEMLMWDSIRKSLCVCVWEHSQPVYLPYVVIWPNTHTQKFELHRRLNTTPLNFMWWTNL